MKRSLISTVIMCAFSCLMAGQAMAEIVCPPDTTLFTSSNGQMGCIPDQTPTTQYNGTSNTIMCPPDTTLFTNSSSQMVCIPNQTAMTQLSGNVYNEEEEDFQHSKYLQRTMMEPGFSLEAGLGYSMVADALFQINAEYQFDATDNETMSFGINTKLNFRLGASPLLGLDWAIGPAIHFNLGIFRATIALGIGVFWEKTSSDSDDETSSIYADGVTVQVKPELKFDFVLTDGLWIGFGFDTSLVALRQNKYNSDNDERELTFTGDVYPWFNMDLHVGYKF